MNLKRTVVGSSRPRITLGCCDPRVGPSRLELKVPPVVVALTGDLQGNEDVRPPESPNNQPLRCPSDLHAVSFLQSFV